MAQTRRPTKKPEGPLRAVSYRRVSTREQGDSGLGLEAQAARISEAVERRGWRLVADFHDVSTGKRDGPHGLSDALSLLERGEADVLVTAKLDRLARSVGDFGQILRTANAQGWAVKMLDPELDTSTANGRMSANVLISVAEWEGDIISERTRDALAARRARGERLGAQPQISTKVEQRIVRLFQKHGTMSAVADVLNDESVPTVRGGQWRASTIQTVLRRLLEPLMQEVIDVADADIHKALVAAYASNRTAQSLIPSDSDAGRKLSRQIERQGQHFRVAMFHRTPADEKEAAVRIVKESTRRALAIVREERQSRGGSTAA